MATSKLQWLECSRCSAVHELPGIHGVCRECGGVLFARYGLDEARRSLRAGEIAKRAPNLWRYEEVLPYSRDPVSLGEGMTPLLRASLLGTELAIERLWIKDESVNPTGSFKARGMATAITAARELGIRRIALPSAGNAGGAAAAYAARAGLALDLFLPDDTPVPFRLEAVALGARVHLVDGTIAECGARVRERQAQEGWFDLSTLREPYRLEGKKTLGYELAEQLGWALPDVVVYPTGGGTGLVGMWKAFEEMEQLELVPAGRRPRMVVVQSEGCAPIVRAFASGATHAEPWRHPRTYASGLCVPSAIGDALILEAVRASGGTAVAVSEAEMARAQIDFARAEGVFVAPEGGATLAALRRLVESGEIAGGEQVVLFNTGTGLKYPHIPGLRVP